MHSLEPPYAHNDVNPGNVLLTHRKGQSPLAILMDFGRACPARREIRSRSEALQLQVLHFFPRLYLFISNGKRGGNVAFGILSSIYSIANSNMPHGGFDCLC